MKIRTKEKERSCLDIERKIAWVQFPCLTLIEQKRFMGLRFSPVARMKLSVSETVQAITMNI